MTDEVLASVEGRVGRLRLNRPAALHALTPGMCEGVLGALEAWRGDDAIEAVLIDHASGRGFCAGGDIRMLAASGAGDGAAARAFFAVEYRMNHRLFTYAKPTVAVMDGVTMGGGVGLALPCRYRVATENTRLAMPETAIGLFPDVGGGWYLSRLPGRMGQYLALTGYRLNGAECVALGLATHLVESGRLGEATAALIAAPHEAERTLEALASGPSAAPILEQRSAIDTLFASDDLDEVVAALEADKGQFARDTLALLRTRSPQALKISLKLLLDGRTMPTFEDEMRQEYAVATRVVQRPDFAEGVRAVILDKDNAPRWDPATIAGVSDHMIDQIFAPLPEDEAWEPD
jgi:enoyl-CoA hydratase